MFFFFFEVSLNVGATATAILQYPSASQTLHWDAHASLTCVRNRKGNLATLFQPL